MSLLKYLGHFKISIRFQKYQVECNENFKKLLTKSAKITDAQKVRRRNSAKSQSRVYPTHIQLKIHQNPDMKLTNIFKTTYLHILNKFCSQTCRRWHPCPRTLLSAIKLGTDCVNQLLPTTSSAFCQSSSIKSSLSHIPVLQLPIFKKSRRSVVPLLRKRRANQQTHFRLHIISRILAHANSCFICMLIRWISQTLHFYFYLIFKCFTKPVAKPI